MWFYPHLAPLSLPTQCRFLRVMIPRITGISQLVSVVEMHWIVWRGSWILQYIWQAPDFNYAHWTCAVSQKFCAHFVIPRPVVRLNPSEWEKREQLIILGTSYLCLIWGSHGGHSGARGSVWGTMLQAGRSRVRFAMRSLDFLIDPILPAVPGTWDWLSL
jgi:hypothetical protein